MLGRATPPEPKPNFHPNVFMGFGIPIVFKYVVPQLRWVKAMRRDGQTRQ